MTIEKVTDCDGRGSPICMDENDDSRLPFWQLLHNRLTDDLKEEKHIKYTFQHDLKDINELIKKGMHYCDDCGKEIELKLPTNYKELLDFLLQFTNSNCSRICDDCHIQTIKDGRIIGSVEDGWYPDKEKLLADAIRKHEEKKK